MQHVFGSGTWLGYCTNVHAGPTYETTLANLERFAVAVKRRVCPDRPMGVGLWLSASAARQIVAENRTEELRDWLGERGLAVFTLNGFPYGDFHRDVVKHDVYEPDWSDPRRRDYTLDLIRILAAILPDTRGHQVCGSTASGNTGPVIAGDADNLGDADDAERADDHTAPEGSISTLPLGWGPAFDTDADKARTAAAHLLEVMHQLARIELDTGRFIHLNLEPEPGCALDTSDDVVRYFKERLLHRNPDEVSVRAYLRVCHDVCHAAVMFEDQAEALHRYRQAGIRVGKVQLSSAVRAPLSQPDPGAQRRALDQLGAFREPRYLHQTTARRCDNGGNGRRKGEGESEAPTFYDDLPQALDAERARLDAGDPPRELRTHFHVPLFIERFGDLETTMPQVRQCLAETVGGDVRHFEAETYAWDVLPPALREDDLAAGIAKELTWVREQVDKLKGVAPR